MADRATPGGFADGEMETARGTRYESERTGDDGHSTGATVRKDVRDTAHNALEHAQSRAVQEAREGKRALSHKVSAVANALRRVGDSLDEEGENDLARYGRGTAERVERFAGYLENHDVRGLVSDIEDMARRNPGTFVATTFAAGLLLGRFLRSSPDDHQTRDREWNGVREHDFDDVTHGSAYVASPHREGAWDSQATHSDRDTSTTSGPGETSQPFRSQTGYQAGPRSGQD